MRTNLLDQSGSRKRLLIFFVVLALHSFTFGQTRFYLNLGTASPLTPTFNAGWNVTTGTSRFVMSPTKDGSAIASKTSSTINGIAAGKCLIDQWVSDPLATQTINGTFTGQVRFNLSSAASATGQGFLYLRVINPDGSIATEVGNNTTTNLTTTLTNRTLISLPIVGLSITSGQRICIELGWNYNIIAAVSRTATMSRGSSSGADLTVDNFTTTANNPWVQFSQTLLFAPVNDDCANPTVLATGATCTPVTSNIQYAGSAAPAGACGGATAATTYDVWFRFQATATTEIINLSSLGTNLIAANTYIETLSGACGSLVSLGCQNATNVQSISGLTIGTFYYVRVYVTSPPSNATTANWNFNICVQDAPVNDLCANATVLTSGTACSTTTSNLQYATSSTPAGACGGATATTTYDVWFKFQATATTQTVTLSSLGANLTAANTYIEMLSGACGSLVSLGCQNASTRQTISGLTVGTFYYVRVYVTANPLNTNNANWNFNICIQQPPANDDCAGAVSLIPGAACANTAGTLDLATSNAATPLGCFAAGTYYDVWYSFVATTTIETVTLSSLGTNFTSPQIQIYSGTCGALVSVSCVSGTTLMQTGLTPGNTYYVRIANLNTNPSTGVGTIANFNICVTYLTPPANDDCTGAVVLTSGTACANTAGTFINATPTVGLAGCGNNGSADVWYSFIAKSNHPVITLSTIGSNLNTASPLIQLFTGSCGTLVPVPGVCSASPLNTATSPGGMGLSINSVYYVRITTNTNTGVPIAGNWGFNICIQDPAGAAVDYAKSYVNITDGTVGGTIDPGDVLEIRAILVVQRPGGSAAAVAIDSLAFYDTLTANKGLHLLQDSMALKTNEGKLFRPSTSTYFTDASDADAAWTATAGAGTDTTLQINMGAGATRAKRGKLRYDSKPSNFGSTCIIMATYRVRVNAPYGKTINFGGGAFRYRDTVTNTFYVVNFPKDSLVVYSSPGSCPDAVSPNNIVGDEVNGTFGAPSGSPVYPQNRGTSANTNYTYAPFGGGNGPGDYYYSIANNTSGNGTIVQTVPKPTATTRVFGVWDITGDHTGAVNTAKGNPPCNLNAPISPSNPCGYMLVVNSAYRTDVAFQYSFSGACTETYYEVSAWIKNICSKCGCDSNGVGSTNVGYIPTAPSDSSGVRPNIAIQINGLDYYTTGDLLYQGLGGTQTGSDTLNKWVKRSFVYKTKPGETSFVLTFRNNAPGGGGNDWAIDDIGIRTCYPNMSYSPSASPTVCTGRTLTISDTVRSYYNVYIYYKWQRSTNGGATWTDIAGTSGVATPVLIGPNNYQFINSYTIPPAFTAFTNNGNKYRMVVATNAGNLSGSCNYTDVFPIVLTVLNSCIDIDDDNDGIPDYVEFNNPVALQDANGNGIPNWNDPTYPGFVDNNLDGVNDNFDYGADSDNDGIPNYLDTDFPGFIDVNGDGVNDNSDKDLDGIPNQYDLDSDNDGIPDVVESYGVDTDGDGIIDNYTDTDGDGFSQNVDANNTGVAGSGNGLGAQDFDGDGIPNYLDTDSDNDGIPDLVEAGGADINNDGKVDNFTDANADGFDDNITGTNALLKTGPDLAPVDGRADNYPNKNLDRDFRPNAYDLDSDGDGIVDVIEAGFPDANFDGIVDGPIGTNGWSTIISARPALNLRNTDGTGNPDYLDIDSDDDGIPDNIEGQSTAGYKTPGTVDSDGDGLVDTYDNIIGYGGSGIFVWDQDGDGIPDYRDLDTDNDGAPDIVEGNDFNLNGIADDNVTLTGLDTDGDGLDNRFDSLNSTTNLKGTSYKMGNGGSVIGDPAPGTRSPVQKKTPGQIDRDWRYVGVVLPVQFLNFTGLQVNTQVPLKWSLITAKEVDHFEIERSLDNTTYTKTGIVSDAVTLGMPQNFTYTDDIAGISNEIIYYRLKVICKTGEINYSNVLVVRLRQTKITVNISPNPASNFVTVNMFTDKNMQVKILLIDKVGKTILKRAENLVRGYNNISIGLETYSEGVYAMIIETPDEKIVKQLMIIR